MVSVTVLVVSVFEVIEPWVKLGTTGTAFAVLTLARADTPTTIASSFFICHYSIVNEVVTCPIADVQAPPGVTVIPPTVSIAPANVEVYVVPPSVVENVRVPAVVEV